MSETPDPPPSPSSRPEHLAPQPQGEWGRLIKDARAEKKNQPLPRVPRKRRERSITLPAILIVSATALALHLLGPLHPWPPGPTSTEALAGQMAAVNLAARAVHDYAVFHGRYPNKLEDILPQAVTIEYHATANGFELRAVGNDGNPIVVKSR